QSGFRENYRLGKLVDSIMAIDDVMKVTYLVGKTAGLEMLFKYLLYISDKIDKSQVTIFNLKDNFDYDRMNLEKICAKIDAYKSENVQEAIKSISEDEETAEEKSTEEKTAEEKSGGVIKIEAADEAEQNNVVEIDSLETGDEQDDEDTGLTLIENKSSNQSEAEVFEIESISESVENPQVINEEKDSKLSADDEITANDDDDIAEQETETDEETSEEDVELIEASANDDYAEEITGENSEEELPEIEIEVHKPKSSTTEEQTHVKEEAITNEAYYKFETKFFEEVKILEKLLASVTKDCRADESGKLSERCLQCTTEIIGITSELSNLSRQLSFDLIADVFLTMNIFFTKSISQPELLTAERIKLLDSSLALVNSLIKGEDYLNYDNIVDRMETLKADITAQPEKIPPPYVKEESERQEKPEDEVPAGDEVNAGAVEPVAEAEKEEVKPEEMKPFPQKPQLKQSQLDSANFKLKYLIKEFEKSFNSISGLKGEYSKFDALEKISELNNALRMIAKISAAIKHNDLLKLAEVTYVFLKYVKDYRMDMQEPEIQQIIKYIIFTFKMLLTDRKPEDFNVLVRHLNNPVKIFADS
ncbi:MAG: hypothetical protein JNK43_07190, partial [Ignavibacteria bacterium]|nr:hypothetical protein [Ignavibacteria bacterium]